MNRMDERRRFPRRRVEDQVTAVPTSSNVQVVEISTGGVLLRTSRPLAPGTKGTLRLNLGGEPFSGLLQVRRLSPVPEHALGYHVGAQFIDMSPDNARLLGRFISQ